MQRSRKNRCCEGRLAQLHSFLRRALTRAGFLLLLVLGAGLVSANLRGADARPLLVLGDSNYPPIAFLQDGTPKGIDVDVVKALAAPMHREIRVELMDWSLAQEKVEKGEADGLIGMSITPERLTRFDFAHATFKREFSFMVREGDTLIQDVSDCKDKKIGVTPGGFPRRYLESHKAVNLVLVRNYLEGFDQLKAGTIDVLAADLWVATYLMEKGNVRGLRILERPFATASTAIAVRKGDVALVKDINLALASLRAEGKLSAIEAHWRPQEMIFISRARIRRLMLQTCGFLLAILVASMALWIVTLRKQIRIRKTVESALRESEGRLRMLADASFEGIAVCRDGIMIDANDQLLKILQYERSELIGKPVIDLVAPVSREIVRRAVESNLAASYEHLAVRKDGTLLPVEVCGRTISTKPNLLRVTAVRDIEERKQAEERLKLLQTITMGVATVGDLASALEVMLRRVCDKTGWVLGQAWMPDPSGKGLSCCPAFFAAAPGLDEFRKVSGQCNLQPGIGLPGRVFESKKAVWIQDVTNDPNFPRGEAAQKSGIKAALGVPILSDREVIAVLEFFLREPREEDRRLVEVISAVAAQIGLVINRKRAEEALRKSEEKFSRFFALAPAAMAVTAPNSEGRILDVNREFTRLSGYTHAEAVGRTTVELGFFTDPSVRQNLLQVFAEQGGVKEMELQLRARDGSLVVGRFAAQLIELEGQNVALCAFVDVTRSKEAEEEIRRSREELRALAGRLQAVREEERTRIAREIHDVLAQELTRFKIDLGWLGRRLRNGALEGDARAVQEKVDTLNQLADNTIATVQKIAAELRPVVLDSLGLSAAIEWQAEEFQRRTGIRCEAIVPEDHVQLDRESATGLFRILQESLTNILRHANATHVEIILDVDGDLLRLEVQDNGVGFDQSEMKDQYSLGLLGMRERALLLDGQFEIEGSPGRGTRVRVTMPLPCATDTQTRSEEQAALK